MHVKKLIFAAALILGSFSAVNGQNYTSAIGLRFGYPVSVSYKQFVSEPGAFEIFAGFRSWEFYSWFNIAGLYEHHKPIPGADGLQWYFGGGASAFFWNYKSNFRDGDGNTSFGILGVLGLDYKFQNAPVNLSLDWVPIFFVNGYGNGFGGGYGALSARYTLR